MEIAELRNRFRCVPGNGIDSPRSFPFLSLENSLSEMWAIGLWFFYFYFRVTTCICHFSFTFTSYPYFSPCFCLPHLVFLCPRHFSFAFVHICFALYSCSSPRFRSLRVCLVFDFCSLLGLVATPGIVPRICLFASYSTSALLGLVATPETMV